jgi:glycosyltransferase involved in cell wall biosynthesis
LPPVYLDPKCSARKYKRPIVLFSGRLAPVKGIETLLKAVPRLKKAYPQVLVVLAGQVQMPNLRLNSDLHRGLKEGVLWVGHQNPAQMMKWYQRAAVFVMPSYYETFGISCLEAMAYGLPVVATAAGGLPEVVEDGITGILVPPVDSEALAEAIICLLNSHDLRHRMGQAGRQRVLAKFTAQQVAEQTLSLYKKVTES